MKVGKFAEQIRRSVNSSGGMHSYLMKCAVDGGQESPAKDEKLAITDKGIKVPCAYLAVCV